MIPSATLTKTETDVLTYLVLGLQRAEIAQEMKVSGASIKNYTSQLVAKFGGANLRDTFFQLKEYHNFFIAGDFGLFYHKIEAKCEVHEDTKGLIATKISDVEVVHRELSEDRFLVYVKRGKIESVRYNGVPMTRKHEVNAKSFYIHEFPAPLKVGTRFQKEEIAILRWPDMLEEDAWNAETTYPCADYTFQMLFNPNKVPQKSEFTVFFMGIELDEIPQHIHVETFELGYKVHTKNPKIGYRFRVDWVW